MAVADLNGDGALDLAVSNVRDGTVSVLLNRGGQDIGSFRPNVVYPAGESPGGIAAGDVNGDGKPDIVVANGWGRGGPGTVSVLLNIGDGTFAAPLQFPAGSTPHSVAIGDLTGDRRNDIVAVNQGGTVTVLINNGHGGFDRGVDIQFHAEPEVVAIADFNSDGKLDLAVAFDDGRNGIADGVAILINHGDGTFAAGVEHATGVSPWGLAVGDLNGDGKPDLAVATRYAPTVSVLLNRGDGTFADAVGYLAYSDQESGASVVIADLNGNGKADIGLTDGNTDSICVLPGKGDGTFGNRVCYPTAHTPRALVAADLNGDGQMDLAACTGDFFLPSTVSVLLAECI